MSTFYDTVRIRSAPAGKGTDVLLVYISSKWPVESGKTVWFTIRKIDEDDSCLIRVKKLLTPVGSGRKIVCNRQWGFEKDDWVVISVTPIDSPDSASVDEYPDKELRGVSHNPFDSLNDDGIMSAEV